MPRDDSKHVAATVHPVILGAPRPKTGRQCEAGFLAPGSRPPPAFPIRDGSVAVGRRLSGYSCGGSHGITPRSLHLAPSGSFCAKRRPKATRGTPYGSDMSTPVEGNLAATGARAFALGSGGFSETKNK